MVTVELESPEVKTYIRQVVLETLKEALAASSGADATQPHSELATLLLLHVRDMEAFKIRIESELAAIKQKLGSIEERLDKIETTMATKDDLKNAVANMVTKDDIANMATKDDLIDAIAKIGKSIKKRLSEKETPTEKEMLSDK
ncbi:MAG: hypothetical protein HQK88_00045 [Nitrospirae bacterium]|nr:hypothetical protein [Nitrospirota bacterium]MBF0535194.1 hypothetical protein [Nitrospirota bacterium]MBF0615187.1 hypothetical protein [Nitrospirota bacterium]